MNDLPAHTPPIIHRFIAGLFSEEGGTWVRTGASRIEQFNHFIRCTDMPSNFEILARQQSPLEMAPVVVPGNVERAMATKFGIAITGFLCCAVYDQSINCLVGIVYRECRGRFRDGATIRTSTLSGWIEHGAYYLFRTVNGSTYVVCDWALEGGSPRFEGILH